MAEGNQPSTRMRIGNVSAAIWKNESASGGFYTVTLQRSYRDNEGKWQNSDQLGAGDLLNAAKVLERAEDWISRK